MGGFQEKIESSNPEQIYNTHVLIDNEGNLAASYRKIHLFDYDQLKESDMTRAGQNIVLTETPIGKLGLGVCYDLRFPLFFQAVRDGGATILTVPAAFTYTTGKAHWHTLLRSRAIEHQCYVVAAAQSGFHNRNEVTQFNLQAESQGKRKKLLRHSFGHSLVIDPWGDIIAEIPYMEDSAVVADTDISQVVSIVDIDLQKVLDTRQKMPVKNHERCDIYSCVNHL